MKIKAQTLSVLLKDSNSVSIYLKIGKHDCNLTLRFDRGSAVQLCGYPMEWAIHDVAIDYYNSDSPTYAEMRDHDGVDGHEVYISPEIEQTILRQLAKSLQNQFKDPMFKDYLNEVEKKTALNKISRAISNLNFKKG